MTFDTDALQYFLSRISGRLCKTASTLLNVGYKSVAGALTPARVNLNRLGVTAAGYKVNYALS
jgi:hypothetical protein